MSDRRRGTPAPTTPDPLTLPLEVRPAFNRRESDAAEALLKQWAKLGEKVLAHDDQQSGIADAEINEPEGPTSPAKSPSNQ